MRGQIIVNKDHPLYDCFGWVELGTYYVDEPNGDIQAMNWSRHYNGSGELIKETLDKGIRMTWDEPRIKQTFWRRLWSGVTS